MKHIVVVENEDILKVIKGQKALILAGFGTSICLFLAEKVLEKHEKRIENLEKRGEKLEKEVFLEDYKNDEQHFNDLEKEANLG